MRNTERLASRVAPRMSCCRRNRARRICNEVVRFAASSRGDFRLLQTWIWTNPLRMSQHLKILLPLRCGVPVALTLDNRVASPSLVLLALCVAKPEREVYVDRGPIPLMTPASPRRMQISTGHPLWRIGNLRCRKPCRWPRAVVPVHEAALAISRALEASVPKRVAPHRLLATQRVWIRLREPWTG